MKYTFVTDFDDTVTAGDTLGLLAETAYSIKPGFKPEWNDFGRAYMADYAGYKKTFGATDTLQKRLEFLRGLESIEMDSVHRVEKSDLYKNVTPDGIKKQAAKVEAKNGWWNLAKRLQKEKVPIHIVSVNWSDVFIRETFALENVELASVQANTIYMDSLGMGTGKLSSAENPGLRTSQDKLVAFRKITQNSPDSVSIYCGDSSTDLAALLEADIGLVIGNEATAEMIEGYGIEVKREATNISKGLYYFDDWTEIPDFL